MPQDSGLDAINVSSSSDSGLDEANTAAQLNYFSNPSGTMSNASGSKLSYPQFKTGVPIDQTILENLERIRIQKQAGQGSLANTLLDTLAIFPGDPSLRSQSIGARLGQRQQEEADIANLTNAVASGRSAQEQTANTYKYLDTPRGAATGAAPGAASGAAPGALSPAMEMINSLPEEVQGDAMNLYRTNLPAFRKLVNDHLLKRPDLQKNIAFANRQPAAMKEAILTETLPKGTGIKSFIVPGTGEEQRYSSAAGMPGGLVAPEAAPQQGKGKTTAADWAVDNGFQVISGTRTPAESAKLVHHYDANGVPRTAQGRPIDLKTSSHFTGDGFDVKPGSVTAELDALAKANGYQRGKGKEENHFSRVGVTSPTLTAAPATVAPIPAIKAPAPSGVGTTVEAIEATEKASELSNQTFHAKVFTPILDRADKATEIENLSNQVLANIEGNKFGPGTKLEQSFKEYAQIVGIPLTNKEMQKFVDNKGIETARKFLSAEGARKAMGAQFTAQESADWFKAFAGIDDQNEYLKNFYQMQRAGALVDKDVADYLLKNRGREYEALNEWKASGAKDRIMQENVDAFKNGKPTKVNVSGNKTNVQKSAGPKASAKPIDYKDFNQKKVAK